MINRKVFLFILILITFTGCFLVVTHEDRDPTVLAVHLLPPKLEELKPEKPIDSFVAIFPFYFDIKFSEKGYPYFLDYSHLPREFNENLAVLLENGIFTKVDIAGELTTLKDKDFYVKTLQDLNYDTGIYGSVKKFHMEKKGDYWIGEVLIEYNIVSYDGFEVGKYVFERKFDNIQVPENLIAPYEIAYVANTILNPAYEDIIKNSIANRQIIEVHRSLKEVIKGKGIITFRRLGKMKGKSKVLIDVTTRIMINDLPVLPFAKKERKEEQAKKFIEESTKRNEYLLSLTVKETKEEIFPLAKGKLIYDSLNDIFWVQFQEVKEFNITPGKVLVVASFSVPKVKEVITKGIYVDVNPDKAATLGLNIMCETKNNLVDMGFVK